VHYGIVDVRLSGQDGALTMAELKAIGQEARQLLGEDFVCFGDGSLAAVVYRELRALDRTLAVAESCTGGLLGDAFTNVPGASKAFLGGVICYSNDVKVALLGVPESILDQHGAVSAECAIAMATGAAERLSADYGLSITGFAGPEGGNKKNPLGTIHIGYHSPVGVWCKTVRYTGGRLDVKARAVHAALDWMRRKLRKYKVEEFLSYTGQD
jgi:nicotinamide-nucleotide amidase